MRWVESDWRGIKWLGTLLAAPRAEPVRQAERIATMQLHMVMPVKAGLIVVMLYFLYFSGLTYGPTRAERTASLSPRSHVEEAAFGPTEAERTTVRQIILETMQRYFPVYVLCNLISTVILISWRRFPPATFQWLVFTLGLLDGLFMAMVTFMTGGFGSIAFWVFPGLIVLNAISIPLATPQISLNLLLSALYVTAGYADLKFPIQEIKPLTRESPRSSLSGTNFLGRTTMEDWSYANSGEEAVPEPFLAQLFVLWLLTACCYGVQVLAERQRRALEDAREFAMREGQLHSAGRLAAEFAHQIKNPLAIINNAVFSLQRGLRDGKKDVSQHIDIIKEEVERSDKIVTQIMGYAQLSEGRVEKLNLLEELDSAIRQVFPPAAGYGIQVERHEAPHCPPLLMQRQHLSGVFVNILQNAREALNGKGKVTVTVSCRPDETTEVVIGDDGPGIPPDKREQIFEAYYTTREKGTGLGLAIVKHNMELYGGSVRVESELGKGARFILLFPAKAVINLTGHSKTP